MYEFPTSTATRVADELVLRPTSERRPHELHELANAERNRPNLHRRVVGDESVDVADLVAGRPQPGNAGSVEISRLVDLRRGRRRAARCRVDLRFELAREPEALL